MRHCGGRPAPALPPGKAAHTASPLSRRSLALAVARVMRKEPPKQQKEQFPSREALPRPSISPTHCQFPDINCTFISFPGFHHLSYLLTPNAAAWSLTWSPRNVAIKW